MKFAILGAGALGSLVGGLMARGGTDVALWDINAAHIDAVNADGLRLDLPSGKATIRIPACRPEDGGPVDVIILLTKTLHTKPALASVADRTKAGCLVLSLQNGLSNSLAVAEEVPDDQVFYGCTMAPAKFLAPGHVSSASDGDGNAVFRALSPAGALLAERLGHEVKGFGMVHDPTGTDPIIWQKAAFNCALNAITALQHGPVGVLAVSYDGVALARDAAAEVIAVAWAQGIAADLDAVYGQMDRAFAHHRTHKPSMLQDIEAGRPTEIEALCGEVARIGAEVGLDTPINRTLATLVRLKTSAMQGENA